MVGEGGNKNLMGGGGSTGGEIFLVGVGGMRKFSAVGGGGLPPILPVGKTLGIKDENFYMGVY